MNENTPSQPEQAVGPQEQEISAPDAEQPTEEIAVPVETIESEQSAGAEESRDTFLFRHPEDKMVGGICGGLGDYFGIDPVLVRIMWVVLTLGTAGTGLLAFQAVLSRDFELIQALVLVFSGMFVLSSFVVDVLYAYLDPRIRYAQG